MSSSSLEPQGAAGDAAELLAQLRGLLEKSLAMAFFVPEDSGLFTIEDRRIGEIDRLIGEGVEVLRRLADAYDTEAGTPDVAPADGGESLAEIGARISSELAAREVSGLAFMARGQLLESASALESALADRRIWAVASAADAGLRHVRKALIALESAICEFEGLEPPNRFWAELEDSLETRRLYGRFRRAILRAAEPGARDLRTALKHAATRIAILRNLEIYPFLRIDDRLTIRRLQKRIVAWLQAGDDADHDEGRRLLEDLESFARLLVKVNHREELREHDRRTVAALRRRLEAAEASGSIAGRQLESLESLEGLDDELDEILLRPQSFVVADLRPPLDRLHAELLPSPSGSFPIPE